MTALTKTRVAAAEGFTLEDVRCHCDRSSWSKPEVTSSYTIVFVRRGCFRRRVDGVESVLDPATAYFERPGEEQQIAHPSDGGDACTQIALPDEFVSSLPADPFTPRSRFTLPDVDLSHRLLLGAVQDELEFAERVVSLAAQFLVGPVPRIDAARRPSTAAARRRVVDAAREALASDPTLRLTELARAAAVSPHHLSRIFRRETGETVTRYRNRIRVRLALERLAEGERRLARLAAELGFADQAHLARVVRSEVGRTPSALRAALAA
jgi:AraC-like DNA-binding protein